MSFQKDLEKLYVRIDQEYDRVHGGTEAEGTGDSSGEWTKVGKEVESDVDIRSMDNVDIRSMGSWDHDGWDHDAARQRLVRSHGAKKPPAGDAVQHKKEFTAHAPEASVSDGSPGKATTDDHQRKFRAQEPLSPEQEDERRDARNQEKRLSFLRRKRTRTVTECPQ